MSRRSLRHPLRGTHVYPRPAPERRRGPRRAGRRRMPRLRPWRAFNVAALVASPEDVPSRPRIRLRVIGVIVFALFAVMVLRLWSLQVINRRVYAAAVNANQIRTVTVPAPRGLVVDRNSTVLAGNLVQNEIVLSRVQAAADPTVVGRVAALAGVTPGAIQSALADQQYSPYEPVPVMQNAPPATVQYLDAHQSEFPGVSVEQVTVRDYPQGGTLGNQILGYVGPINGTELKAHPHGGYSLSSQIGKTGIESQYERYLRGRIGRQTLEVNATGTVVGTLRRSAPTQGDTVVLNITAGLQSTVQHALSTDILSDRTSVTHGLHPGATNGAAVVIDAQTGAVLALASYPSYSLTEWVGGISTANYKALQAGCNASTGGCPLNDYAIQGLYTPGSTFKLATATAALQDGVITPYTPIDDTGVFNLKTKPGFTTCTGKCSFHDATAFDAGVVNVTSAITESDDYFFYTLGLQFYADSAKFGATAIQKMANQYGFGVPTGIDLPDEVSGRVDSKPVRQLLHKATPTSFPNTYWYPGTNIEMAFGQGETVITPVEEAQAYATFADHGVRHQPEVAGAVVAPTGKLVKQIAPRVTGKIAISPADYTAMLRGFIGVTHTPKGTAYGTFQQYSHLPSTYVVAGKTGTATTATLRTTRLPNAWFVGFGPTGGTTQYVVAVAVAQGGFGASAAAPAVANIFNYLYANPPSKSLTLPTVSHQPSTTPPPTAPPAGTPTTTTTTTTVPPVATGGTAGTATGAPVQAGAAAVIRPTGAARRGTRDASRRRLLALGRAARPAAALGAGRGPP